MLFQKMSIFGVLQSQTAKMKKLVEQIHPDRLLNTGEEGLVQDLAEELELDVPVLDETNIHTADFGETQVDISGDPTRRIFDRSRPHYVKGVRVTVATPFSGNGQFFHVQLQALQVADIGEVSISDTEVLLTYRRLDNDAAAIKRSYEAALQVLRQNLANLKTSVDPFNLQLEGQIRQERQSRKAKLLAIANMVEALGLPIKTQARRPDHVCRSDQETKAKNRPATRTDRQGPARADLGSRRVREHSRYHAEYGSRDGAESEGF